MQQWLNYRVRVIIKDNRRFIGVFIAFDRHMNLVLADCEEYRMIKKQPSDKEPVEIKRTLGFVLLRGENVVSFTAESAPASTAPTGQTGPGKAVVAGRGMPYVMPVNPMAGAMGLTAPLRGMVGPGPIQMTPR